MDLVSLTTSSFSKTSFWQNRFLYLWDGMALPPNLHLSDLPQAFYTFQCLFQLWELSWYVWVDNYLSIFMSSTNTFTSPSLFQKTSKNTVLMSQPQLLWWHVFSSFQLQSYFHRESLGGNPYSKTFHLLYVWFFFMGSVFIWL